jgi:hypothetical protein
VRPWSPPASNGTFFTQRFALHGYSSPGEVAFGADILRLAGCRFGTALWVVTALVYRPADMHCGGVRSKLRRHLQGLTLHKGDAKRADEAIAGSVAGHHNHLFGR